MWGCRGGGRIGPKRGLFGKGKDAKPDDVGVVGVPGGDCDMVDDTGEDGSEVGEGVAGTTSG